MVLMPGGEGRRDPEQAEAARRQRARFARDIGDERSIAWAHEPRRPRGRFTRITVVALLAFAGLGAIPLFTASGDGLLPANCSTPELRISPDQTGPGGSFAWQVAGPAEGSYVVTVDNPEVVDDGAGGARVTGGQILGGGPLTLSGCRSAQLLADAPEMTGTHEVALFRRSGVRWERLQVRLLRVS